MIETKQLEPTSSSIGGFFSMFCGLLIVIAIIATPLYLMYLLGAGRPNPEAQRILTDHGYTDVVIKDGSFFGCNHGDISGTNFEANDPITHIRISGEVCTSYTGSFTIKEY